MKGFRMFFIGGKKSVNFDILIFFIAALYLFIASFFYATGPVLFLLALAFTGIFIGLSKGSGEKDEFTMSFLDDPRKSFFSILVLVFIMVISAAACFKYIERFASVSYYADALSSKDIMVAEASINKAISLHPNDLYLRTYAQVYLVKLNSLIAKNTSLSDTDKTELQADFDKAISGAQGAIAYNQMSYLNFNMLGSVYSAVAPLGVAGAYDKAIEAYKQASILNPLNPGIKLEIARAYSANGKTKEAKDFGEQAIALKADYLDALVTLSQIAKNDNDNALAISYAEKALTLSPANKDLASYVNSLKNGVAPKVPEVSKIITPKNKKK